MAETFLRWACSRLVLLVLCVFAARSTHMDAHPDTYTATGTCRRIYILAASVMPNSTHLHFTTGGLSPRKFTFEIPEHILPSLECRRDYVLCNILLIERGSEFLIFLPSQGGFVKVAYQYGQSPRYSYSPVKPNCHPVKSFYNKESSRVLMECLNLTINTDQRLYIAELNLRTGGLRYSDRSQSIQHTNEISPAIHARDKIFLVDNEMLLYTETTTSDPLRAYTAFRMPGCSHVHQIDAVSDELVYMYCNNRITWSATTHAIEGNSQGSYAYPCVGSDIDLHVQNVELRFNKTGSNITTIVSLPSEDIVFGLCHGSESNGTLAFWGQTGDGLLFSVDLSNDDHNITYLSQCPENATCLRPAIERGRTFGGYFDYDTNFFHIRNFTGQCGHVNIELPFPPDLLQVFTAQEPEEDDCPCPVHPFTEPPTEATTNASDINASSMPNLEAVIAGGVVGSVVGLSLVAVAFIVCVVCRRFWPSDHVSHKGLREVSIEGGSVTEDTEDKTASKGGIVNDIEMEALTSAATNMASPDVAVETLMPNVAETESTHSTTQAEANQRTGSPELPKLDPADSPPASAHTPPASAHTPPASAHTPPVLAHTPPVPASTAMPETSQRTDNAELCVNASTFPPDLRRLGMKKDKNWTMSESPAGQPQHCPNDNEDSDIELCDINRHMVTTEAMPAS